VHETLFVWNIISEILNKYKSKVCQQILAKVKIIEATK